MTDRDLLSQALDALRQCEFTSPPAQRPIVKDAITALRSALAAPMPEPVARVVGGNKPGATPWVVWTVHPQPADGTLLYTATPPAIVPAAPPTDEQIIEAASNWDCGMRHESEEWAFKRPRELLQFARAVLALSTAPVVRKPLTDEQINDIWNAKDLPEHRSHLSPWGMDRIRAIIAAANGIGGGGNG